MTSLSASTLYYVRSYATNSSSTNYGPEITFTTAYAPDGSTEANAASSGLSLKQNYPSKTSGWYWIKSSIMPNELEMYVDMTEDGGGYDFYFITGGPSVSTVTEANGGTPLKLDLVMPRSAGHWKAMANAVNAAIALNPTKYSSTFTNYFQTAYGVYNQNVGNYTSYIMRDPIYYGTAGAATNLPANSYRVKDGGRWWLRNSTYSEPNGDYGANGLLGQNGTITSTYSSGDVNFNDLTSNYATGNYYLVSTNTKQ